MLKPALLILASACVLLQDKTQSRMVTFFCESFKCPENSGNKNEVIFHSSRWVDNLQLSTLILYWKYTFQVAASSGENSSCGINNPKESLCLQKKKNTLEKLIELRLGG